PSLFPYTTLFGSDAVIDKLTHRLAYLIEIEPRNDATVAVEALADLQPVAPRHQRVGETQEQVVDVVALLRAHFERVTEALRGEQAEPRATAFDDRVGDQRRAVNDLGDVAECE